MSSIKDFWLPCTGIRNIDQVLDKGDFLHLDIAYLLWKKERYSGAFGANCNVLAHQVTIYNQMKCNKESPSNCLYGLIHDVEEAFLCDRVSPVKARLAQTSEAEKRLEQQVKAWVLMKLNIDPGKFYKHCDFSIVKMYDSSIRQLEVNSFETEWADHDKLKKSVYTGGWPAPAYTVPFAKSAFPSGWVALLQQAAAQLPKEVFISSSS